MMGQRINTLKPLAPLAELTREQLSALPDRILNEGYAANGQSLYIRRASGCYIEDIDGKKYIDMALGGGTAILGHANQLLTDNLTRRLDSGTLYAVPNPISHQYGELLHYAMPWFENFVFCSTGSEATMRAMRIARAFSGKKKIALFSGCWHGSHDMALVEEDYSGSEKEPKIALKSAGTPEEIKDLLLLLPYNDSAAFDLIRKHRKELAMVMIEPSQGSNPRDDISQFLKDLRLVTKENNVLLCFDEIITGGRLALGGAQELYGIHADLATYGKLLGGGLPIGIIGGTPEVMRVIRQEDNEKRISVFMGGTFSGNPLSVAAGMEVMRYLKENKSWVYESLSGHASLLKENINQFCSSQSIPVHFMGVGSMLRLVFSKQPIKSRRQRDQTEISQTLQREFYNSLLEIGIHVGSNRLNFLSIDHDRAVIDRVIESYIQVLDRFKNSGKFS